MRTFSLVFVVLAACSPSTTHQPADAPPDPLPPAKDKAVVAPTGNGAKLRSEYRMDRQQPCGGGCNFREHGRSAVTLTIGPNGRAEASDVGHLRREYRAIDGAKEELTEWRYSWTGSWAEKQGVVRLRLAASEATCRRRRSENGPATACEPFKKNMQLVCERIQVDFGVSRPEAPGWVCGGARLRRADGTLGPWLFSSQKPWRIKDVRGDRVVTYAHPHRNAHHTHD